jgi:hypothetical protein
VKTDFHMQKIITKSLKIGRDNRNRIIDLLSRWNATQGAQVGEYRQYSAALKPKEPSLHDKSNQPLFLEALGQLNY